MRFVNALAWCALVWSLIVLIVPLVLAANEELVVMKLQRTMNWRKRLFRNGTIFAVSLLWLIFGG